MAELQRGVSLDGGGSVIGASTALASGLFTHIAKELRENVGLDLGSCRHDLALKALSRRLRARQQDSLKSYTQLMLSDGVEPRRLARVLLAADGDVFLEGAGTTLLGLRLAATHSQGQQPQLWVVECGEGDEVYALALRIHDLLAALDGSKEFVVHGSESDLGAIELARAGVLSNAFVDQIPRDLGQSFFVSLGHGVAARPELMRYCQFHHQVLMAPPPVAAVDVISGRGILRFLSDDERRQLLTHWHQALKPGGLLLLAPGESVADNGDLFVPRPLAPGVFLRQAERGWSAAPFAGQANSANDIDVSVYRRAFSSSLKPSALFDADGRLLDANLAFAAQLEANPRDLMGLRLQDICTSADREAITRALTQRNPDGLLLGKVTIKANLQQSKDCVPVNLHINLHEGHYIRAQVEIDPIDGEVTTTTNVEPVGLLAALETITQGLMLVDGDGRIQLLNPVAQRLIGWSQAEALGRSFNDVFRLHSPLGERLVSPVDDCLRSGTSSQVSGEQANLITRDGRRLAVDVQVKPVPLGDGSTGAALAFEDISQRLLVSEELAWRATHDPVTGLLNRDEFELRVRNALTRAHQGHGKSVVCFIDIDQFRLINDVLDHTAGDEMLHELAAELRVRLCEGDALARLSGDEFGVLLPGRQLSDVEATVQELLEAARRFRFQWLDRKYSITVSIGVAQIDASSESAGRVLSLADAACHSAKAAGRDRAKFMGRDVEAQTHHTQMGMVGEVGRAIEEGRLLLVSEDVVRVDAPDVVVYRELLVRLRGEDGALLKPVHFVPAAERYFLMTALDRWVMHEAMSKLATLAPNAHRGILYALNVSGQSLSDPEFLDYVIREIEETGVDPHRLCFELTETAAVSRLTDASRFVTRLTALGCQFALDDFGVGMSSFGYLKNFPVHFLKIDGSFVRSMRESQIDRGVVETINRIGHQLGLKTIAEHVESLDLLEPLKLMGVDWAQGHGIAPARSLDDLLK